MTAADDRDLLAEVQLLRAEVAAFTEHERHREHAASAERKKILAEVAALGEDAASLHDRIEQMQAAHLPGYLWPRVFLSDIGTNPLVQYRIHIVMTWFWIIMTVVVTIVFFNASGFWAKASIFYIVLISHYANGSTEFGSASASLAGIQAREARKKAEEARAAAREAADNGKDHHDP